MSAQAGVTSKFRRILTTDDSAVVIRFHQASLFAPARGYEFKADDDGDDTLGGALRGNVAAARIRHAIISSTINALATMFSGGDFRPQESSGSIARDMTPMSDPPVRL